jgi:hypothetical protein
MKTDELIAALARGSDAVDPRLPLRRLLWASLAGVAAAIPIMLWRLGINPDLAADARMPMFWVKWGFVGLLLAASAMLVGRVARPGQPWQRAALAVLAPPLALWALAAAVLVAAPASGRAEVILGSSWDSCPYNIVLLSLPSFVLLFAVVRTLAPTRLRLAGAATGLLAGTLGTSVYLLHCPEYAAPFLATWYLLGMTIPALAGALIGPRVLRW